MVYPRLWRGLWRTSADSEDEAVKATLGTGAGLLFLGLGYLYGYGRAAVAIAMGAGIVYLGYSYFNAAGQVPPDVATEDVSEEGLRYICRMCGLELKVETATTDRAPSHCREKMELVNVVPARTPPHPN